MKEIKNLVYPSLNCKRSRADEKEVVRAIVGMLIIAMVTAIVSVLIWANLSRWLKL